MNQRGVRLLFILGGLVLLFYAGARWFFSTNDFTASKTAGSAFSEETFLAADEGVEKIASAAPADLGSGGKSPSLRSSKVPIPRALGTENVRLLERCFSPAVTKLQVKASDDLSQVLVSLTSMDRFERSVEIENIHFNDESGVPLRFQILTENESRFFRVDPEGLPIRIDPPRNLIFLKPVAQKEALMNAYRTPVFSESFETYSKVSEDDPALGGPSSGAETPGFSAQIHKINGEVVDLQIFYKDPEHELLRSAGCSGEVRLRCKCL